VATQTAVQPLGLASGLPRVHELPRGAAALRTFQAALSLPYVLFLDSALLHEHLGRYSYVAADPFAVLWSRRGLLRWHGADAPIALRGEKRAAVDPFRLLGQVLDEWRCDPVGGLPPFQGGAAGFFGYGLCHHIERLPRPLVDEFKLPDLVIGFYDWVVAFDHFEERGWLISTGLPERDPRRRRKRAGQRLAETLQRLQRGPVAPLPSRVETRSITPCLQFPLPARLDVTSNFSRDRYLQVIRRAVEYVHAGDCFQVNIAQRLLAPLREHPVALYLRLRERNPAPFAGYLDAGNAVIASASPERFLSVDESGMVETRPIKGTRPRGLTRGEDDRLAAELADSAKDRAENVMIVDLLRNDLGRVCRYGSVTVEALCKVESYRTVHHLVSVVKGRLRPDSGRVDLLRAAFPGGSVTGAPKVRAMEIIAELEPTARGPYCGSLGYLGFNGSMDTSILIRTFTAAGGGGQFPVGGGIVADSSPEREYEETLHKAEGLLRALA